jgi:TRAP-type C4-dicarboxylate transport system substrate-binding protein
MVASDEPDCRRAGRGSWRWRIGAARWAFVTVVTTGVGTLLPSPASAATTFRVATLAPRHSTWGKVYSVWAKAIEAKTGGALTVQILWSGTGGIVSGLVGKIKAGQLEGGSISLPDLAVYYPDVFAVELPGTTKAWGELDRVRAAFQPDVAAALEAEGVRLGWWEDWGRVRLFTRGYSAARPLNLVGKHFTSWVGAGTGDPVIAETLAIARGSIPTATASPGAPPDGFFGPATLAGPLAVDHVGEDVLWCGTAGAMVFGKGALASLPADVAKAVNSVSIAASRALADRVRSDDDATYNQIAQQITVVTHTPAEASEWSAFFSRVAAQLSKSKLEKAAVNRVLTMRGLPVVP